LDVAFESCLFSFCLGKFTLDTAAKQRPHRKEEKKYASSIRDRSVVLFTRKRVDALSGSPQLRSCSLT